MISRVLTSALVCGTVLLAYSLARAATMADIYLDDLKQEETDGEVCRRIGGDAK